MRFRIYVSVLTVISPVREASLRCLPPPIGSETACSWSRPAPAQEDPHHLLLLLAVQDHLLVPGVAVVALPQDVHLVLQAVHLPAQARLDTPLSAEQSNTNRERRGLKEEGLSTRWSHILQASFMPRLNWHNHQGKESLKIRDTKQRKEMKVV